VTAIVALSFELVRQMSAPDFDPKFNLHRAKASAWLTRMRMEAWVEEE